LFTGSQTESSKSYQEYDEVVQQCTSLSAQVNRQQEIIRNLQEEVRQLHFGYDSISDADFPFYTGLTKKQFDFVATVVQHSPIHRQISLKNHLLIVFLKLRLALLNRDIGLRFSISPSAVSAILRSWIPAVAACLKALIVWPEQDVARCNVPASFKPQFQRVISIIDCFEVFTERPYNLTARAQTWSNYKHHNTVKYLISITPFGAISFLSEGWGGRVSDKQLTLESGYMHKLLHGDEIMADRGFLIKDECAALGVTVHLPAFTKGHKQLPAKDVLHSRKLASLRIHVERVIGNMRNYTILQSTIPVNMMPLLNDMIIVIAACSNLKRSIVSR